MKKSLLFLMIAATGLVGCTPSGKIDCATIVIMGSSGEILEEESETSHSYVYEYVSDDGLKIYTSNRYITWDGSSSEGFDFSLRTYRNRYSNDFTEYTYSRFVGFLTQEYNFYLDLNKRMIDIEIKWTEYKELTNPVEGLENPANNKEAYQCAKKSYYQDDSVESGGSSYKAIYLDSADYSLERHAYASVGQEFAIVYTVKK